MKHPFRNLDHVGITVPDLASAIAYFTDVLGATEVSRGGPMHDPTGTSMADTLEVHPRARLHVAVVRLASGELIELLQYDTPDPPSEKLANSDHGSTHLAFTVDNIHTAWHYLSQHPSTARIGSAPNQVVGGPNDGMWWFYFRTPWGLTMEVTARITR
jgi:catechol 2,3-dioxygenase-like lactoylglutathione lyase family enzyme